MRETSANHSRLHIVVAFFFFFFFSTAVIVGIVVLEGYPEYHTNFDDLNLVKSECLLETLKVLWVALLIIERAKTYKATYTASPFMFRHGIFPYQHGAGVGGRANEIGDAYFAIIPMIDGTRDLLEIADWADLPIFAFDECVADFLKAGLMTEAIP